MKTTHKILFQNAHRLTDIQDKSIDLMVTSPPYPMIQMWDSSFSKQNPNIAQALKNEDGNQAFELMHEELDKVWKETHRVLQDGGYACINIGDATRKTGKEFKLYSNHTRILQSCLKLGFAAFPEILWRKQTNAPTKFMGSGMLPAGAYVTLEHEFILILRKGSKREFKTKEDKLKRQKSAYFWEERNQWFSDIWENLKGTKQNGIEKVRARSGAYPFELAYRLVNMFSIIEDTVLDPFLGTGTTMAAAMATARNSIGIEIDKNLKPQLLQRLNGMVDFSNRQVENRIKNHLQFIQEQKNTKRELAHKSKIYGFPIITNQEKEITFNRLREITFKNNIFEVEYMLGNSNLRDGLNKLSE
jgi:modification methylase